MRWLVRSAYRLRRGLLAALRWRTRGVKVMVFDHRGALLLVRHSYGRTDLWQLPGGGIARRETPAAAAAREVREETGCTVDPPAPLGVYRSNAEGKRDTVFLFRAQTGDAPVADGIEVIEARFFALEALPAGVSAATRRRIDELAGAPVSERW